MEKQEVSDSSFLKKLHPFIDKEGLLRVEGALQQFHLPYQTMQQMIFPSNHQFTKLVASVEHISLHHSGPQILIALQRERYWLPRVRNLVKTIIHHYLACYRFKAQATQQLMGELPSARVQSSWPFLTTVVDYAGPISLRLGPPPSKTITKVYIAMFVCLLTRAVNTEIVTGFSTEAFLAALRRFIACREKPRTICSDNVPTFKVLPTNFMQSTKCFNPLHRWQQYRTSWPLKDANGNSIHTSSSLRRIMGNSSEIHDVSSAKNTTFSGCHLRGSVKIT